MRVLVIYQRSHLLQLTYSQTRHYDKVASRTAAAAPAAAAGSASGGLTGGGPASGGMKGGGAASGGTKGGGAASTGVTGGGAASGGVTGGGAASGGMTGGGAASGGMTGGGAASGGVTGGEAHGAAPFPLRPPHMTARDCSFGDIKDNRQSGLKDPKFHMALLMRPHQPTSPPECAARSGLAGARYTMRKQTHTRVHAAARYTMSKQSHPPPRAKPARGCPVHYEQTVRPP